MRSLQSTLFAADSSLLIWNELSGRASGILLWMVTLRFPIVHKVACECSLGGDREEGHGGKAWIVIDGLSFPGEGRKGSLVSWWPFVSDWGKIHWSEVRVLSYIMPFSHQDCSGKGLTDSCRKCKSSRFLRKKRNGYDLWRNCAYIIGYEVLESDSALWHFFPVTLWPLI